MAKKTPFLSTYVAAGIFAALLAWVFFVQPKKDEAEKKPKALVFDKAKVKAVTLEREGSDTIKVVKEATGWRLKAPLDAPADGTEIESLLTTLEGIETGDTASEAPKELGDFGLKPPRFNVSLGVEGVAAPVQLLVGTKVPAESTLYAKLPAAAKVFTIPAYLEGSLDKKPFDFRDREVLHVKRDAIRTIEVAGPEGGFSLARDDKGGWAITKPLTTLAGRWSVEGLLGSLESLRMEQIADEDAKDLKPFGLDKPKRSVALGLADGTQKTLEIGSSPTEKKYHAREAANRRVVLIPGALVDDLAKGMAEYRQKRVLDVPSYDVDQIEVETGGKKYVYSRTTEKDAEGAETPKWKRTAPDHKELETSKVQDALFKVGNVEAKEFVDAPKPAAAYGLDAPAFKLSVRAGAGKPMQWAELAKKDADAYARRDGDAAVLKVDSAKMDELVQAFKALK